jgi:serine/threonine protein kinase
LSSAPRIERADVTDRPERPERTDRTDRIFRVERELPRPFVPARSSLDLTGSYTLLRPFRGPGEAYLAATPEGQLCVLQLAVGALPGLTQQAADERWLSAAESRRAARHPALLALLDVGVIDDSLYVVTEYLAGRDLHEIGLRASEGQHCLPLPLLLHIARELSRGLGHLHSLPGSTGLAPMAMAHGALHGDNVLCGWEGEVKLADRDLSGLFSSVGLRTPWSLLRPPPAGRGTLATPTPADDLAGLAALLSDAAGGAIMGLSSSLLALLQQAAGGKGSAPPWVAPLLADDLRQALSRELAQLPGGLHDGAAGTAALVAQLSALYGEQIDQERHEAARWLDAVSRTVTRSSGRPAGRAEPSSDVVAGPAPAPAPLPAEGTGRITQPNLGEPAPASDALIIDGRYRLLRLIGIGGMGAVYEAQHVSIGKRIAVKVLHQQFSQHPDLVERLRREAQAASRIGHPNIIDVIDFGYTSDGSAYIAMEFLEGTDLGAILRNEGRVKEARALRIGLQTARALAAAHRVGIVHRDLKPENIFVVHPLPQLDAEIMAARSGDAGAVPSENVEARPRGVDERELSQKSGFTRLGAEAQGEFDLVKVLDFGVAAHLGAGGAWPALPLSALPPGSELRQLPGSARLTNPGLAVGTPEYMAPEQALGQEVDARADVYAVGTLMFEMLCGRVPFVGNSAAELLALKTGFDPPLPRLFAPTISAPLEAFILRCLARDCGERPQSMEEVELRLFELSRDSGALSQPRLLLPTSGPALPSPSVALHTAPVALSPSAAMLAERIGTLPSPVGGGIAGSPLGSATSHGPSAPSHDALPVAGASLRHSSRRLTATALVLAVATVAIGFVTARYLTRPHPGESSAPSSAPSPARSPAQAIAPQPASPAAPAPTAAPAGQALPSVAPPAPPVPAPDARVVEVLEGRVPMLFEWARRTVAGGRFVTPPGDNLLELLTRIEDVAPNHPDLPRLRAEAAANVLRRGREHLRRRQPLEAFELYRTLLAIEGGVANLGAVRAAQKPTGLARRFPRSELQLQLLYVARTGRGAHGAGLAAAHAAIEVAPRSAAAHLALADALLAANRRDAAATEYRRVLELHPRALERRLAEHGLGRLGLRPGRPARAH